MNTWKKFLPDVIVVVLFAVISFAYFLTPVIQGKVLYRHDTSAGVGAMQELWQYKEATGETLDELRFWRYAYLSNVAIVPFHR